MTQQIFIDTEFTDFINTELISIGMVTSKGAEFYGEVPFELQACSPFVLEAVVPQLGQIEGAMFSLAELGTAMLLWLEKNREATSNVEIIYDYSTDWDLFCDVLNYRQPAWCRPKRVSNLCEADKHSFYIRERLSRHHALYDAKALKHAYAQNQKIDFRTVG
ncbi:3'-5' exoribonuclease [uncultured Oxalicibacterium sp.]|uniref:3'-5' exoribonuclease n=1 Tax=uncultured Oxalicibacterium sp. TaxID=1168540 RepID=UPI0025E9BA01|nr:3'-5' exoribonuclease [uncultured Oxalicibacterium sp.]